MEATVPTQHMARPAMTHIWIRHILTQMGTRDNSCAGYTNQQTLSQLAMANKSRIFPRTTRNGNATVSEV